MAMFPVFIIGLGIGILASRLYSSYREETPSEAKFKIQEEQLKNARLDAQAFEEENARLRGEIEALKAAKPKRGRKPKAKVEE